LALGAEQLTPEAGFNSTDKDKDSSEIRYKDRPILRYMHPSLDESSKEKRELTYKVFHHLYDPAGKRLVTKGPGGLYTHHRGLFYGFNRISYDEGKKKADTWHCTNDAHLSHEGLVSEDAGPAVGRLPAQADWHVP